MSYIKDWKLLVYFGESLKSDQNGRLNLDSKFLQNQIWTSKNDRKAAFVLHNFESYQIQVQSSCGNINKNVQISSGIGEEILKEEWR